MASVSDFKLRFPEFTSSADERIQLFLDDAALKMYSEEKWLTFYDVAQLYLAAHYLALSALTDAGDIGISAPVKHQEVGDVVVKNAFADVSPTVDELYTTAYGKRYIKLRQQVLAGPRGV